MHVGQHIRVQTLLQEDSLYSNWFERGNGHFLSAAGKYPIAAIGDLQAVLPSPTVSLVLSRFPFDWSTSALVVKIFLEGRPEYVSQSHHIDIFRVIQNYLQQSPHFFESREGSPIAGIASHPIECRPLK